MAIVTSPATTYINALKHDLRPGAATEESYRPALKGLLEKLAPATTATTEPKRVTSGAPDYVITRNANHGALTIGYIETKDLGASLAPIERDSDKQTPRTINGKQLKRYRWRPVKCVKGLR